MTYSRRQILLHWAVVLLIAVQFIFHDGMSAAWRSFVRTGVADPGAGAWVHIVFGVAVLVLAPWRIGLRLVEGAPELPSDDPAWQRITAAVTHWGLYALMILLPVSGSVAWFLGVRDAAEVHEVMKTVMLVLIVLHVVGALYHQFVQKDGLMRRMSLRG